MADKIPYEVLLPTALELYQKIPQDKPTSKTDREEVEKYADQLASDFANFYINLHQRLVNQKP